MTDESTVHMAMQQAKTSVQMEGQIIEGQHSGLVRKVLEGASSEEEFAKAVLSVVRNKS
ncbi:hypothetical protein [Rossellomorea marisflavi]|uniref:hypothetical protein n=1 Tax=Rossellomorea marisflavi TaxID=189381 RepID=UPI00203E3871|nr:hypothetical protein [Rossellomorea marisflavi]MCM2589265.1 hypothetical protein [Rossellomorea marisflavi]